MKKSRAGANRVGFRFVPKAEPYPRTRTLPGIRRSLRRRLERHFLACSASAAVAGSSAAQAGIVYRNVNAPIPVDDNGGLFLDVDSGLFNTGTPVTGYDLNFFEQAGTQLLQLRAPNNGTDGGLGFNAAPYTYLSNVPADTRVPPTGATPTFVPYGILAAVDSNGAGPRHGPWANGVAGGFIGFRFVSADQRTLYGWARLNVYAGLAPSSGNVGMLVDYAFDDSGAPIFAGQVASANIKSVSKSGGTLTVRVPSVAGLIYRLEKNDSLTNPNGWSLVTEQPGTGAELPLMDSTAGSAPNGRRFYRVVVQLQPE